MHIILVSGKAGSGKDTFYELASEMIDAHRLAYADGVKDVARFMGWDGIKDDNGRSLLITIGESARNYIGELVWINKVIDKINLIFGYNENATIIITDCRHPNEITKIRELYPSTSVRMTGRASDLGENASNISETDLDDFEFDFYIDNSGTKEELKTKVRGVLDAICN